ncbi:aminocarboxymuconate-semialdehyde decarboxylase [Rhizobiales bacterium GAS191]|jgi:aminocarboxymuconate-semialdehyde decarboxylase|nr:aminocarboxymuconate-semialdehyde decarboxylase [Rhizobiales bacterium GAS113]SED98602.1 aminocarboxymuconate-semialdehyde decarboxylase [Rhizobiales bacterium GAS191]SEE50083.1 aminocarboxymuconate-semialdehyde decarboxylase [Rhizobiales bacterium GAS188]
MRVDVHAHIVDRCYLERLESRMRLEVSREEGKTFLKQAGSTVAWYTERMFDVDARLRDMDRQGIDMRLLSVSTPNVYPWDLPAQIDIARDLNEATARLCRRHPGRLRGLAALPLLDPAAALAELERALSEPGMVGIAMGSNLAGRPLNDPLLEPIWERLADLDLPIFIHPMFPANVAGMDEFELPIRVGFVFDTTVAAARLIYGGVLERHPRLTIILAHTGGTLLMLAERLDNGYRLFPECRRYIQQLPSLYMRRLYYDTGSFFAPALAMAHGLVGADRILYGSDDPFIGADTSHVEALGLPRPEEAAILGGNAARLFRLGSPASRDTAPAAPI